MILKKLYPAHDSDGKCYEVHVYAEQEPMAASHPSLIEKLVLICTAEGHELRVLAHGRYEIIETAAILHSSHPDAI